MIRDGASGDPGGRSSVAGAGVGQTFGQSAPAIDTRIRWPAANRQPVASTSIVSGTTTPGSSGCGSVKRRSTRAVEHALGDEVRRAVGVDVRQADGDAEDVDVRGRRGGPPGRVRGSTAARRAARSCRSGTAPRPDAGRPVSPNCTPPDHSPLADPDGRIDERGGRPRPRRRPCRSSSSDRRPPAPRSNARSVAPAGGQAVSARHRPALSSRSGASEPASCMNTTIGGSSIRPSSRPRHQ